jgi:integrase
MSDMPGELVVVPTKAPTALPESLLPLLADLAETLDQSVAENTKRAYAADWRRFESWCQQHEALSLPAAPKLVALYLNEAAGAGRAVATLARWLTSIGDKHTSAGYARPGDNEGVKAAMKGIRHRVGTRQRRVSPLLTDDLADLVANLDFATWPNQVSATRDAAVLLAGFAGAFRRSELASLTIGDVRPSRADGVHLVLRRSKTDQTGAGHVKPLPYGRNPLTCAPCAIWRWIAVIDLIDDSRPRAALMRLFANTDRTTHSCRNKVPEHHDDNRPLFRSISRHGHVGSKALSGAAVGEIVKRRAAATGLNPDLFSGHSLRSGFVTQAIRNGQEGRAIRRQTGHHGDAILDVYYRENAPMVGNAVTALGL